MVVHKTVALPSIKLEFTELFSIYKFINQFIDNNRDTLPKGLSEFFDSLDSVSQRFSHDEGHSGSPSLERSINAFFTELLSELQHLHVAINRSSHKTSDENCNILNCIIDFFFSILTEESSKKKMPSISDIEVSKEKFKRELKQFREFKLTKDEFGQLGQRNIQILNKKRNEAFWHQTRFEDIDINWAWTKVLSILHTSEFDGVLRQVSLSSFFSSESVPEEVPMIVPHSHVGVYELNFMTIDLDQMSLCHPGNLNFNECRICLKWIIAFIQMKAGLITSDESIDAILDSYVSGGIMALVVGAKGTSYNFPFGISIGSVEDGGAIRYKGQYLLQDLQGRRVSTFMDQLILKQLIQKYKVHFPLNLTARSTTLAVLSKMPGFLESLHQLAQFMTSIHALYDSRCFGMYQKLQVLMVNCDSGNPQIREFLTYINGFGVGSNWRFQIQIELYQLLVRTLTGANVLESGFQSEVDALRRSIKERYGLSLSTVPLLNLYGFLKKSDFVFSLFPFLALSRAIAEHAPTQQRSFSEADVRDILDHYKGLLYPGRSGSMYSELGVSFEGLEFSMVSHFFVQLQRLYFQFRLADINVHFGFDLLVLFASQKQNYGRVGQWNKQLSIQRYLGCLSTMKKSVLSAYLAHYFGSPSGALTPELLSQFLISGIQTGAYFEHTVPIDNFGILEKYFKSTCPSVSFLRQSKAHYYMSSALVQVLEHILILSDTNLSKDLIQTRKTLFSLHFLKVMETLNELFPPEKNSFLRVILSAICCVRYRRLPISLEWPKDLDLIKINMGEKKEVFLSYLPWKSGWDAPLHALYGVSSITGEVPLVTNAYYELDKCIDSVVRLLIDLEKDTLPYHMRSKIDHYKLYLKCAKSYLVQVGILKTTEGFSECHETDDDRFINFDVDRNDLKFPPDILASLFFLRNFVNNEPVKGICVVQDTTYNILPPPGSEFERSNAIYIAYDLKTGNYARLKNCNIEYNTFDCSFQVLSQGAEHFSPTVLIPYLCDHFSSEHWHSVAHNSVKKALAFYLRHHDPDEYDYKQKALVDDLRRISGYLENFPNIDSLQAFWDSIPHDGPVYKILCSAFSNMDRQASAR